MRKLSDKTIKSIIDNIDKLKEECDNNFPTYPDFSMFDKYGSNLDKEVRRLLKHTGNLKYIDGFWYGYVIGMAVAQNENLKNKN